MPEYLAPIAHKVLFRESRRVLVKIRDFERGRKVERLFQIRSDGQISILKCVRAFRSHVDCLVKGANDERLKRAHSSFTSNIDCLLRELETRASKSKGNRRIDPRSNTAVIRSFKKFQDHALANRSALAVCNTQWAEIWNEALNIWGSAI